MAWSKEKRAEYMRAYNQRPDQMEKARARARKRLQDPEKKVAHEAYKKIWRKTPEAVLKHREEAAAYYHKKKLDPEWRARKNAQQRGAYLDDIEHARFMQRKRAAAWRDRHSNQIRNMWRRAKERAKQKNLPFNIELSDIVIPTICPVLQIELRKNMGHMDEYSPSLDRIIPARGYVKGNVRIISSRANRLKCDATAAELKLVYEDLLRIEQGG